VLPAATKDCVKCFFRDWRTFVSASASVTGVNGRVEGSNEETRAEFGCLAHVEEV
jgi:hypothetical protein